MPKSTDVENTDVEMKLCRLVRIDEKDVIQNVIIGEHGQTISISQEGGRNCKQIGVTFNSVNEMLTCKDTPCDIDSLDDDIIGFCRSGLWLTDLVDIARLNNQRYCLAKKNHKLIMVSQTVDEELSKEQSNALQGLQSVFDQKNLFETNGERDKIFHLVTTFENNLDTVESVREHKGLREVYACLHDNMDRDFDYALLMDNIFYSPRLS